MLILLFEASDIVLTFLKVSLLYLTPLTHMSSSDIRTLAYISNTYTINKLHSKQELSLTLLRAENGER